MTSNNTDLLPSSSGGRKMNTVLLGLKPVLPGPVLSGGCRGESISLSFPAYRDCPRFLIHGPFLRAQASSIGPSPSQMPVSLVVSSASFSCVKALVITLM